MPIFAHLFIIIQFLWHYMAGFLFQTCLLSFSITFRHFHFMHFPLYLSLRIIMLSESYFLPPSLRALINVYHYSLIPDLTSHQYVCINFCVIVLFLQLSNGYICCPALFSSFQNLMNHYYYHYYEPFLTFIKHHLYSTDLVFHIFLILYIFFMLPCFASLSSFQI